MMKTPIFRVIRNGIVFLTPLMPQICLWASGPTTPSVSCHVSITDNGSPSPPGTYSATCSTVYLCSPSDPWPKSNGGILSYVASVRSDDHCYDVGYNTPTTNSADLELVQYGLNGTESGDAVSLFFGRVLSYRTEGNGCAGPYTPFYSGVSPNACTPPPPCAPDPPDPPDGNGAAGYYEWSTTSCTWVWHRLGSTPIIIDTDGSGFHLTSAENGIKWDFYGDGHPIQIAWTALGATNGWLALDRNGNGRIDNAGELFGDVTQQPMKPGETSKDRNGFLALAVFDSNGDGVIDKSDPIWPKLLLWIDSNHDGISQPGELHHLDDMGIRSIALAYRKTPITDSFGNQFRYKGHLNPDKGDDVDRVIYDVILTTD